MTRPLRHAIFGPLAAGLLLASFIGTTTSQAAGPGFDCVKATRQIEKAICAWDTVGTLDGDMAVAYRAALAAQTDEDGRTLVEEDHKRWLAARDEQCALDAVTPDPGSEEGLSPREFGQLLCLQDMYPSHIAHLEDMEASPLLPTAVTAMPTEALSAAYPEKWRQLSYQAQYSPDGASLLVAVSGVVSGYTDQLWLYWPQDGHVVAASPLVHGGPPEGAGDISEFNGWFWGEDGMLYIRARRPLGKDGIFAAGRDGHSELAEVPAAVTEKFEASDEAGRQATDTTDPYTEERRNEQQGGAYTAWAVNTGHGFLDVKVAQDGKDPRIVVSGTWEMEDFVLDGQADRVFYNGKNGLLVTDISPPATRRLAGTHGGLTETKPLALAPDGSVFVYVAIGSCSQVNDDDDDDETGPETEDANARRVCLAELPLEVREEEPPTATPAGDPWVGEWKGSGAGMLRANIRRGTAKPEFLVVDIVVGMEGCAGAVTVYGKPDGNKLLAESYDANDPRAPACRLELDLMSKNTLQTDQAGGECTYYHGAACDFSGELTR